MYKKALGLGLTAVIALMIAQTVINVVTEDAFVVEKALINPTPIETRHLSALLFPGNFLH